MEHIEKNDDAVLFSAFLRAQRKFNKALKKSENPHFKSRYADLTECVEAVIDALQSEGFALTQFTEKEEHGAFVRTVLLHETGGLLTMGELFIPASRNDAQGFGSALTYARRYSLMSAMGLAPTDDDGESATGRGSFLVDSHILADHLTAIADAPTEADLLTVYKAAFKATQGDANAQKRVIAAKDARKKALGEKQ